MCWAMLADSVARRVARRRRKRFFEQWFLAYRLQSDAANPIGDFARFRHWAPPGDRYWADPFPVIHAGNYYLFFEEFLNSTQRGRIVASELRPDGSWANPRIALRCPYHLSYPHVFCWQGSWYMLPETRANRTIELWRAESFPYQWTLDCQLFHNVGATDSTMAEIDGRFWLFSCMTETDAPPYERLFLFHADSPRGPWLPHRRNPVVSDVRHARPAGRLFQQQGNWIRPAQDCSGIYGRRMTLREITKLTPDDYDERAIGSIEPTWAPGLTATHTLNTVGALTVIDGCRPARRTRR